MGAAEVGDVEALDPHRRHVEAERALQPLQRLDAALAAALGAQVLLVEREARVALGELEDAALVAALGGAQLHGAAAAAGECLGEGLARGRLNVVRPTGGRTGVDQLPLHDDLRRDRAVAGVVLEHELLRDLGEGALGLVGKVERLAVGEHPVAHLEHLRVGLGAVERHGHGVERADRLACDALALQQRAHCAQAVALERGLLVLLRR